MNPETRTNAAITKVTLQRNDALNEAANLFGELTALQEDMRNLQAVCDAQAAELETLRLATPTVTTQPDGTVEVVIPAPAPTDQVNCPQCGLTYPTGVDGVGVECKQAHCPMKATDAT